MFQNLHNSTPSAEKREGLFQIQSIIVVALLGIMTVAFSMYNHLTVDKEIKLLFAPFLSIVPTLFILSVIKDLKQAFETGTYSRKQVWKFSLLTLIITGIFTLLCHIFSTINTLEIMIALGITLVSFAYFIRSKIRSIAGMSILTGISEGIIVYMIFIF